MIIADEPTDKLHRQTIGAKICDLLLDAHIQLCIVAQDPTRKLCNGSYGHWAYALYPFDPTDTWWQRRDAPVTIMARGETKKDAALALLDSPKLKAHSIEISSMKLGIEIVRLTEVISYA